MAKVADQKAPRMWKADSHAFRKAHGIALGYRPWTSRRGFRGNGLPDTDRVKDLLDCYVALELKKAESKAEMDCETVDVESIMQDKYMDVSQSLNRHAHTNAVGCNHAFTTGSQLYDFNRDCILTGREMLALRGQSRDFIIIEGCSDSVVRELAGEGMSIPCLSAVIWCLYLVQQFPE